MSIKTRFIISSLIFSALVFAAGVILFTTVLKSYFIPVFYYLVIYFLLLTLAGRFYLMKSKQKKPGDFNIRYFLVRWLKVLLHLIFIVIYIVNDRTGIPAFVLTFLALYVLYSIFDIYTLSFYLKKVTKSESNRKR